jgi:hypothetical protein
MALPAGYGRLAAPASRALWRKVAGRLWATFHAAEQMIGPHAVVLIALAILLDRGAV